MCSNIGDPCRSLLATRVSTGIPSEEIFEKIAEIAEKHRKNPDITQKFPELGIPDFKIFFRVGKVFFLENENLNCNLFLKNKIKNLKQFLLCRYSIPPGQLYQ